MHAAVVMPRDLNQSQKRVIPWERIGCRHEMREREVCSNV